MKSKDVIIGLWMYLWIKVFLWLDLRKFQIEKSRDLRENDKERMALDNMKAPGNVEEIFKHVRYHEDPFNGLWDYINSPEYMYFKIKTWNYDDYNDGPFIGDCDDYAFMFGKLIVMMDSITEVKLLCACYRGGAHSTCLYKYKDKLYMYDYGIFEVEDIKAATALIASRYSKDKSPVVRYSVIEDIKLNKSFPVNGKPRLFK